MRRMKWFLPADDRPFILLAAWPDGAHDLFGFTPDVQVAQRRLDRDQGYWRAGPVRPVAVYLMAASAADVDRHRVDGCRRSGCPDSVERGQR